MHGIHADLHSIQYSCYWTFHRAKSNVLLQYLIEGPWNYCHTCVTSFGAITSLFHKSVRFSMRAWANNLTRNGQYVSTLNCKAGNVQQQQQRSTISCRGAHNLIKANAYIKTSAMTNQTAGFFVPRAAGSLLRRLASLPWRRDQSVLNVSARSAGDALSTECAQLNRAAWKQKTILIKLWTATAP